MPIRQQGTQEILVCVNAHPAEEGTTMIAVPSWVFLQGVLPPQQPQQPAPPGLAQPVILDVGFPVRVYWCHVCGYVEFYSAAIVDPQLWGNPLG